MNEQATYPKVPTAQAIRLPDQTLRPSRDLVNYARQYARQKPAVVALCCLGIGFVLGWKIKPW